MSDFIFQVDQLSEKSQSHRFEASRGWWEAREAEVESEVETPVCIVETPFVFEIEASRKADQVLLTGELAANVILECSRCARRYPHALRDTFRLALEPAKGREPVDLEGVQGLAQSGVWLGEDLEAGWYKGPLIRLDDFFGEVIALAMPLQPICTENCPGICSHCGVDLAKTQCECADEEIESPFAVLAKLKDGMKQS